MTEKLFYSDSHLKEFTAEVLSCRMNRDRCEVELTRTAFFPEGGGQYADTGILSGEEVIDVQECCGKIYHILKCDEQRAADKFIPGCTVEGRINWKERFMKMQQHTGEHIVSGLIHARFGYHNVGFHLGSENCTMDFDGCITKDELREIEREANKAVWKNLPVEVYYPSSEELKTIDYRSKIEIKGQVRLVVIPGYDVCACCAPHVNKTGEIGVIKLTGIQRYKGGVRVTMLCGVRALSDYEEKQRQVQSVSAMLCAKEYEIADAVEHLRTECSELKQIILEKENRLISYYAEKIPEDEKEVFVFTDEFTGESARRLMNCILNRGRTLCAVFSGRDEEGYQYVIGSRKRDVRNLAKGLNTVFDGRGGGKPEMVQGTVRGRKEEMREWIREKARSEINESNS